MWKGVSLGIVVVLAVIGLWLAYVAQSGYTPRAKVSEGINLAGGAKAAVAGYYADNGRFPVNNAEAYLSDSISGRFTEDISVQPGGIIQITYGGSEPDETIAGKTLLLQAVVAEDDHEISWSCKTDQIPSRHIPASCK